MSTVWKIGKMWKKTQNKEKDNYKELDKKYNKVKQGKKKK